MKNFKLFIIFVVGILIGAIAFNNKNPNAQLEYGSSGLPKNCRAIIYENYKEYSAHEYTAEEAIDSINRNCGKDGYSWEN